MHVNDTIQKCNEHAFRSLFYNYSKTLYGVIYTVVKDSFYAQDVLQSTFIKIWAGMDQYDTERGSLYTWMIRIARNNAIDHIRSGKNRQHADMRPLKHAENALLLPPTDNLGLQGLVNALDLQYRQVIVMIYFNGYTIKETAEYFSLPEGTVKTRLRKAIKILRSSFEKNMAAYAA